MHSGAYASFQVVEVPQSITAVLQLLLLKRAFDVESISRSQVRLSAFCDYRQEAAPMEADAALALDNDLEFETSKGVKPITTFEGMKLKAGLLKGIYQFGFEKPSAIQQRAIIPIIDSKTRPTPPPQNQLESDFYWLSAWLGDCKALFYLSKARLCCRAGRHSTSTIWHRKDVTHCNYSHTKLG